MYIYLSPLITISLFVITLVLVLLDQREKRVITALPHLSFIVPSYNDLDSVEQTIDSIYEVCGPDVDLIVIDDCSTDGSIEKFTALTGKYGFTLVHNESNQGKSKTINDHFHLAKNDLVVLVDADIEINRRSLSDAVARLQDPDVGAVSCPYKSADDGLIPLMQSIEFNMIAFIQGAYNVFSAITLWGGFIVIKRKAFLDVEGFSRSALTEDLDLACKLNTKGWRVKQSLLPVRAHVPCTFREWVKQRIRWYSGNLQCLINYYQVWLKNPLHLIFVFSFSVLYYISSLNMSKNIFLVDDILGHFDFLVKSKPIWTSLQLTCIEFGFPVLNNLAFYIAFTAFSLPFALPLISSMKKLHICLIVIPFSIIYVPSSSIVSTLSIIYFMRRKRLLQAGARAW